ncbi:MotA/TolQ/ExbB proton channel family protein [Winogradskyella sediminis]|uniref:MotA/TolQ/ExbB proton channel family protein n=1 Tax=Winogradskyella sediminis TaxID=1382466 RepID=A0A1H1LYF8_9FLAO|nr:MotA/TolQ/ExbB proton channel family protein [Winogradskyella sediminis]SDR78809.1 MotA/TolQ/ExbB proton channel family protein [Winogradskyella sediminis]
MNELVLSNVLMTSNQFADRFNEGGPFFMSLILICLLLSVFFLIKGFISLKKNKSQSEKMLRLTVDASLLGLVLGFLGSVIGLITAFDSVEAMGNPDPSVFAGGLKVSLLTATFGLFSFVIARIGILLLRWCLLAERKE